MVEIGEASCFKLVLWWKWIRQELGEDWFVFDNKLVIYRHGRYWALGALTFWWWVWLVWPVPSHPSVWGGRAEVRGWVSPGWSLPYRGKYWPQQYHLYYFQQRLCSTNYYSSPIPSPLIPSSKPWTNIAHRIAQFFNGLTVWTDILGFYHIYLTIQRE